MILVMVGGEDGDDPGFLAVCQVAKMDGALTHTARDPLLPPPQTLRHMQTNPKPTPTTLKERVIRHAIFRIFLPSAFLGDTNTQKYTLLLL